MNKGKTPHHEIVTYLSLLRAPKVYECHSVKSNKLNGQARLMTEAIVDIKFHEVGHIVCSLM